MKLGKDISCEHIGDQWVVVSHVDGTAHHLSGDAATVIDYVIAGRPLPAGYDDTVNALVHAGILAVDSGWSRRQILTTGAAAAAVGISSVALPAAALAASSGNPETLPGPNPGPPEPTRDPNLGVTWLANPAPTPNDNFWRSVTYGDGTWVAVASSGTNRVMTSANGATWSPVGVADGVPNREWWSVAYGNGAFVAVAAAPFDDTSNRVMTSANGTQWAQPNSGPTAGFWRSVAYGKDGDGNGLWVAVGSFGNRVMTSTNDGITWTSAGITGVANAVWRSVAYGKDGDGNGLWVASGTSRVMTSADGQTWTERTAAAANSWESVAYGNGLWVAVSSNGTSRVMTSPDGQTWTERTAAAANSWESVAYRNGLWVAVSSNGTNRVMTSPDGETWTARAAAEANPWQSVAYADEKFVAVASDGTNRTMVSPDPSA